MKAIITVLVVVLLGTVGLGLGFVIVSEQRTIRELERDQEQASAQFEELSSDVASLSDAPEATDYADDIATLQDSFDKLTDKVDRIDMRTIGLPGWDDLTDLAKAVDDNYAHFDECVTDLLDLSNGYQPSDGLVC